MSALHGPARTRKARSAPPRRSLNVVARPGTRTPRAPFVSVIVGMVIVGLVGLLVLNTTMQKRAFELARLQDKADSLATREAALDADVQRLSSPAHVAERAGELGMVPNTNPVFLRLSDGKVIGEPEPAQPGTNLPGIEPEADHKSGQKRQAKHERAGHEPADREKPAAKQDAGDRQDAGNQRSEKPASQRNAGDRQNAGNQRSERPASQRNAGDRQQARDQHSESRRSRQAGERGQAGTSSEEAR